MHEPSLRGTDGELVTPWGSDALPPAGGRPPCTSRYGGALPLHSLPTGGRRRRRTAPRAVAEVKDRLWHLAGRMAESDIMSGLPTGTEAAR